ncbi:MAG: chorismate mutase [Kiritimatiellia bacterium]|jgi:chorismate mutase
MRSASHEFKKMRQEIDRLDARLVELLNRWAKVALCIGKAKRTQQSSVYVPAREKQVFGNIRRLNSGPLPAAPLTLCAILGAYPHAPESNLINAPSKP